MINDKVKEELRNIPDYCDLFDCDVNYYDNAPMTYLSNQLLPQSSFAQELGPEHFQNTPDYYSSDDLEDAKKYAKDIAENCGDDTDCLKTGNRFSKIYAFSGVTMILLALNSIGMLFGSCSYHVRGLTTICGALFSILNFAAIITAGVFRFNSWGKLSALCQGPTRYEVDDEGALSLSDEWTV